MNAETNQYCLSPSASVRAGAILALSVIAAAAAVAAQSSDSANNTRSQTVSVADLDLSTPDGMSAARKRVQKTAQRLCFQLADPADLSHQANYVKCVDEAVTGAMHQVTGSAPGSVAQSRAGQHDAR
jgi:UrcA family protein